MLLPKRRKRMLRGMLIVKRSEKFFFAVAFLFTLGLPRVYLWVCDDLLGMVVHLYEKKMIMTMPL